MIQAHITTAIRMDQHIIHLVRAMENILHFMIIPVIMNTMDGKNTKTIRGRKRRRIIAEAKGKQVRKERGRMVKCRKLKEQIRKKPKSPHHEQTLTNEEPESRRMVRMLVSIKHRILEHVHNPLTSMLIIPHHIFRCNLY